MCNCTLAFLVKHVRILGPRQPDDPYNQLIAQLGIPREARRILNEEIGNDLESVKHRAGIILQARAEEMDHDDPNTVMFMDPATFAQFCAQLAQLQEGRYPFECLVRIPWIVTWRGISHYQVIENAAGFSAATDDHGCCNHYSGPLVDALSITE